MDAIGMEMATQSIRTISEGPLPMAADIFPGESPCDPDGMASELAMHMDDDGYYWHLYRYFESAKLPSDHELIDLYGGNAIDGYELDRLREKMVVARNDLQWRGESWEVVTGWKGTSLTRETEIRRTVTKAEMTSTVDRLIALIGYCKGSNLKLCVCGD